MLDAVHLQDFDKGFFGGHFLGSFLGLVQHWRRLSLMFLAGINGMTAPG
jgi:hypothetical protein